MKKYWKLILIFVLGLHFILLLKLKFTAWPEMITWPYLMLNGWLPYKNIAIVHTPLMLADIAIFNKLFGVGILQLKIFTWILILLFDYLVFWVARRLWDVRVALYSLLVFVFLQIFFDGNGLWFDLYMGGLAFISFYLVQKKSWFWAGVLWALAFISKQTAVWFLIPIAFELIRPLKGSPLKVLNKGVFGFVKGSAVVGIFLLLLLLGLGIWGDFWAWAVTFGIFTLPGEAGQIQMPGLKNLILAAFPATALIPLYFFGTKKIRQQLPAYCLWGLAGALGAYPRFEFFHLQPAVFYIAILTGVFLSLNKKRLKLLNIFKFLYVGAFLVLFAGYFVRNYNEGVRFYETDVRLVSDYVKDNADSGDVIFVLNYWDNIYPLTGTFPATDPWIPQLAWYTEIPGIQEKMVKDLEKSSPGMILFKPYTQTGLSSYIPEELFEYINKNYEFKEKVNGVEILIPKK
jgi:hypothetical protein